MHNELTLADVATFSTIYLAGGGAELIVPTGSMTIRQALKSVSKDFPAYKHIFQQIGGIVRSADEAGFGVPARLQKRSLLGGLAFSLSDDSAYGSAVRLTPPYAFDPSADLLDYLSMMGEEVGQSQFFGGKQQVDEVVLTVAEGYDRHVL